MDERLSAALAAIQRVEEVLEVHADAEWARCPETQKIREAIAGIDTMEGAWEPIIGAAPPVDEYRLSTRCQ
ncbi:hypothetical protein AB0D42_18640 [Streptomyces sp. NPDC048304]|uniref:hypothetical protein n=1 Tax=Streptomyces sp. NPDC048304 TaxID=3154820 RepID=UPI0033C1EE0B